MLGRFSFENPTKLYFGEGALENLGTELAKYGKTVQLIYGGGSIKRNGIYNKVVTILKECGKEIIEDGGVMPNPTLGRLYEGIQTARDNKADLLLAVGGGSCCDYAKALSASVNCPEDPWERYYVRFDQPEWEVVPVGCVLTMTGTGSEMNGGAVITNQDTMLKLDHGFPKEVFPRFSILDPTFTFTLPEVQMTAGIYDIFNHICEQYFSGDDDNTSDYISEGLMRSLIRSSRIALKNPRDYEARSNIMWTAAWALNGLVACGKSEDWMVHKIGQSAGAYTDAIHGMTLSAVSLPYYRYICPYGLPKFARFAREVWGISGTGKPDRELAEEGLQAMEAWMKELGLAMSLKEIGATEEMIEGIADGTVLSGGGYRKLSREEVIRILRDSL